MFIYMCVCVCVHISIYTHIDACVLSQYRMP